MLNKVFMWKEVLKLGFLGKRLKDVNQFFRRIVVEELNNQGFFNFLKSKHNIDEIAKNFNYTDIDYLKEVLFALLSDKTINYEDETYFLKEPLIIKDKNPVLLNKSMMDYIRSFGAAIPARLKGEHHRYTTGYNLFNFDDALNLKVYSIIRKAAFAFLNDFDKEGRLLDIGCGSGLETVEIWNIYFKKGFFSEDKIMEIYGMDIDEDFLKIAEEEFLLTLSNNSSYSKEDLLKYKKFFPKFKVGTAIDIPFEDDYFDFVFISQVLHWTDSKKALSEISRVLKPGGILFGSTIMKPTANEYLHIMLRTVEGANGFFDKQEFKNWLTESGFKKMYFSTPLTIFKCIK